MPPENDSTLLRDTLKRWTPFLVKALVVFAALALVGCFAPVMPPACVALCWAALSAILAVGLVYLAVIRKARKQHAYVSGGLFARVNSGRFLSIIAAFVVAAVCVAGLLLEAPKWGIAQWVVVFAAIPAYVGVYEFVKKRLATQYEPLYQTSKAMLASSAIVCALLCAAYLLLCLLQPAAAFDNITQAYQAVKQPFEASPSALLVETGKLVALVDAVTMYGMAKTAEVSFGVYLVWRVGLCVSAFFGVASLVGTCVLRPDELKLAFQPLDATKDPDASHPVVKRYVAMACVMAIALVAGFLVADAKTAEVVQTEEYTAVESFVRDQVGLAVYVIDGKYYDEQKAKALMQKVGAEAQKLAAEREEVLVPLINEAFDKRVANVDAYLDWYYSLPADYERLAQYFTGTIESGLQEQLQERINQGIDESAFAEKVDYYLERSEALKAELREGLAQYEVADVPDWLVVPVETFDGSFKTGPLAPTQKFLDAGERMGISVGVGAIAGVIATKVAQRIAAKPFFKKIVASLLEKLAIRGLLAAGGTAIAPGVGTAVGVLVGTGTDYLFLKADEAMNRESYKEEIVAAIEESRTEMLEWASVS